MTGQTCKESILLDFSPIHDGGGCQLALNFLKALPRSRFATHSLLLVLPENGPLADWKNLHCRSNSILIVPKSLLQRGLCEWIKLPIYVRKSNVVRAFTFFGSGLLLPPSIMSIVSVAYPIICYDDSPYWNYLDQKAKLRIAAKNLLRRRRLKRADFLITETPVMAERLANKLNYPESQIKVIPPAVSEFVEYRSPRPNKKPINFLLLSGNSPHKNLWRLYDVAIELIKLRQKNFRFILSVTKNSWLQTMRTVRSIQADILDSHFDFIGSVPPMNIQKLYDRVDALLNLSDLESFSNNYMEAWKAGIPLVVSDRDFARFICRKSALYVEPHYPLNIAEGIANLIEDAELRNSLTQEGKEELKKLPRLTERMEILYDFILHAKGPSCCN